MWHPHVPSNVQRRSANQKIFGDCSVKGALDRTHFYTHSKSYYQSLTQAFTDGEAVQFLAKEVVVIWKRLCQTWCSYLIFPVFWLGNWRHTLKEVWPYFELSDCLSSITGIFNTTLGDVEVIRFWISCDKNGLINCHHSYKIYNLVIQCATESSRQLRFLLKEDW